MPKLDSIEIYKKKFFNKYPNSNLFIIGFLREKILIKDEFGYLLKNKRDLLKSSDITIQTALFKNFYFINKANKIHNFEFDYSNVNYKGNKSLITISCKKHGNFKQRAINHLLGSKCPKCQHEKHSKKLNWSYEDFFKKANKIHNNFYDYSNTIFINTRTKLKINCKLHGEFEQRPSDHLSGNGCRKCGNKILSEFHRNKPNSWIYNNWFKLAKKSKLFDSFKVYIIKCWNENESFYKIGKTYKSVFLRFNQLKFMPYNYEILKILKNEQLTEESSRHISELEQSLKNLHKDYKYFPKIPFGGMHECFTKIIDL